MRATRDRLKLPDTVRERATGLGMVRGDATTLYFLTGEGKTAVDDATANANGFIFAAGNWGGILRIASASIALFPSTDRAQSII